MPQTEQCPLGRENKANIDNVKDEVNEFKGDMKRYMETMNECVSKLTNHYSQRPSWIITMLISALIGLCVFLIQYSIKQGNNEPSSKAQPFTSTTEARAGETARP